MADIETGTSVVPPAETHHQTQGGPIGSYSRFGWLRTPKGILRVVQWLFSIIVFACVADMNGYDHFSQYQFQVAVGAMLFIYTTILIACYIFRPEVEQHCLYLPVIELVLDGIFFILILASSAATAAECDRNGSCDGYWGNKWRDNIKASIVFGFFTMITLAVTFFFSYRENAAEEAKR